MALRQIKLRIERNKKYERLEMLRSKKAEFKTRTDELETALDEAESSEDVATVEEQISELEAEISKVSDNLNEEIETLTADIERIDKEIEEINQKAEQNNGHGKNGNEENRMFVEISRAETRELVRTGEYYRKKEVIDFYDKLKNLRNLSGSALTIPNVVINRIMDILGDYSTIYPMVDKISCKGTARILVDTDTTEATWTEQNGTITSGDVGTIGYVDFDGFKIGKATFIDINIIQDSIINVDAYVVKKLARAIALGLDKAILKGEGSSKKQPIGIIPSLDDNHKVEVINPTNIISLVKPIGIIDTGEDSVGEIVAVMSRKTYYNKVLDILALNLNGGMVGAIPAFDKPNINGLKVIFNNYMTENDILYGDFSKYTLVERDAMAIESDKSIKFLEDQIAYKGRGRFDGKPTSSKAFVLATLTESD